MDIAPERQNVIFDSIGSSVRMNGVAPFSDNYNCSECVQLVCDAAVFIYHMETSGLVLRKSHLWH